MRLEPLGRSAGALLGSQRLKIETIGGVGTLELTQAKALTLALPLPLTQSQILSTLTLCLVTLFKGLRTNLREVSEEGSYVIFWLE